MLAEKMKDFHDSYELIKLIHLLLEATYPAKDAIVAACKRLKVIIDSDEFAAVDEEVRTAFTSVYNILETALSGLNDESVSSLFNPRSKY